MIEAACALAFTFMMVIGGRHFAHALGVLRMLITYKMSTPLSEARPGRVAVRGRLEAAGAHT